MSSSWYFTVYFGNFQSVICMRAGLAENVTRVCVTGKFQMIATVPIFVRRLMCYTTHAIFVVLHEVQDLKQVNLYGQTRKMFGERQQVLYRYAGAHVKVSCYLMRAIALRPTRVCPIHFLNTETWHRFV